jgi:predicted DNA-binding antitoxin AbrB/MazE fold protein
MSHEFRAIFEHGILRPLDPTSLVENDVVTVVVQPNVAEQDSRDLAEQHAALRQMFAEADSLPNECPGDNFSGADHDLVLYGWKK